jgi:hypothetical protein
MGFAPSKWLFLQMERTMPLQCGWREQRARHFGDERMARIDRGHYGFAK